MVLHYLGCRLQHGGGHVTDVGTLATVLGLATGDVVGALGRLRIEGMVWPCDNGLAVRLDAGAAVGAMPKTPMSGPEGPLTSFGG